MAKAAAANPHHRDLTSGNLWQDIWYLSWPTLISMVLQTLPTVLDGVWLGRLGADALAAAGIGMALRVTLISPLMALSSGGGAVVARYVGARDQDRANSAVLQSVLLFTVTAGVIGALAATWTPTLLRWAGASGPVLALSTRYARVLFLGLIAMELVPSIGAMLTAAGSPQLSLRVNLLSGAVALILEPALVLGVGSFQGLGIMGASLALVIGYTIGMIYSLHLLLTRQASAWIDVHHLTLDWPLIRRIVAISLPAVVQRGMPNLAQSILLRVLAGYGSVALATFNIITRIFSLASIPSQAIGRGAAALVGQNLGARQPARAERGGWYIGWSALGVAVAFVGAVTALGPQVVAIFTDEAPVIAASAGAMVVLGLGYICYATGLAFEYSISGAGDTLSPMVINALGLWAIQIPLLYVLAEVLGHKAQGVWWAYAIGRALIVVMTIVRFRQGRWKLKEI